MAFEISDALVDRARDLLDERGSTDSVRDMLTVILGDTDVRRAIYEDVRRETEAELKAMGVTGFSVEWDR